MLLRVQSSKFIEDKNILQNSEKLTVQHESPTH